MTETTEHTIPEPVRDLLQAVRAALDIPHPATYGDRDRHAQVLADRAMHTVIALADVLDTEVSACLGIEWTTTYLRARLAEHPPTGYQHAGERRTGGPVGGDAS
ncbi:hypothetical protein [Streptomyces sp. NPDC018031]|uniref:hypothetical protein n=1 Tax=Streptomyces sp. NPDC018031 TaxID=3365033 RepID=UPI0037BA977D